MVGTVACLVVPSAIPAIAEIAFNVVSAGSVATTATATLGGATAQVATASGAALATAGTTTAIVIGPLAIALIGHDKITFDCWKQVLHDTSPEPSKGLLLIELLNDKKVKSYQILNDEKTTFLVIENIWNEKYRINFFNLNDQLVGHVVSI